MADSVVVNLRTAEKGADVLVRFRFRMAKFIYDRIFIFLIRDESWRERFFSSFTPDSGDRILHLGPQSSLSALSLAERYSDATFSAINTHSRTVAKLQRRIIRQKLYNINLIEVPNDNRLPFKASSFDKVVSVLGLYDRPPDEKLGRIKEIARVLRRGGTLYVIDFDKPEDRGEGGVEAAQRILGSATAAPFLNESWISLLSKGGFAGVRRQSSHSFSMGRLLVVKARKR